MNKVPEGYMTPEEYGRIAAESQVKHFQENIAPVIAAMFPKPEPISDKEKTKERRDWLAAVALGGLLSNPKLQGEILKKGGCHSGWLESSAYAFADAMIAEGEK